MAEDGTSQALYNNPETWRSQPTAPCPASYAASDASVQVRSKLRKAQSLATFQHGSFYSKNVVCWNCGKLSRFEHPGHNNNSCCCWNLLCFFSSLTGKGALKFMKMFQWGIFASKGRLYEQTQPLFAPLVTEDKHEWINYAGKKNQWGFWGGIHWNWFWRLRAAQLCHSQWLINTNHTSPAVY